MSTKIAWLMKSLLLAGGLLTGCGGGGGGSDSAPGTGDGGSSGESGQGNSPGNGASLVPSAVHWNFDSGLDGWTVENSDPLVGWNADGSPLELGEGESHVSAPFSLNYNNGVDIFTGKGANKGTAVSPLVDLLSLDDPNLTFWCNFDSEDALDYDLRWVQVYSPSSGTFHVKKTLHTTGNKGECSNQGIWHTHQIPLEKEWGVIEVRFIFDTVDEDKNTGKGWFLDDVEISPGSF